MYAMRHRNVASKVVIAFLVAFLLIFAFKDTTTLTDNVTTILTLKASSGKFRVKASDPEYDSEGPFVLEKQKLIFYCVPKVGSTVWKILFRRLMGHDNWSIQGGGSGLPHNPHKNGLVSLKNYALSRQATELFSSPSWTVAIFVRDPIDRFVSAYLNKGRDQDYMKRNCCKGRGLTSWCSRKAASSMDAFFDIIKKHCPDDPHWRPQSHRLSLKYWKKVSFIGHFENLGIDSETLFRRIHVWDDPMIQTGWGPYGTERIFSPNATVGRLHGGRSDRESLLTSSLKNKLVEFYIEDYEHPHLNFSLPPT